MEVVGDQHDREPLLRKALDEREHLLGLCDAERGGRLVEDDDAGSSTSPRARPRPTGADPRELATGWRIERIVVTESDFSVSAVFCSITGSFSR